MEVNFSTYPENKLEEWHYPKLYQRERFDTFKNVMVKSQGWVTSPKTRPQMLATLHTVMDEEPGLVVSAWTLGEMITFVYDENRKPQAAAGEHDDLVMAAAIAHTYRTQQRYTSESGSAPAALDKGYVGGLAPGGSGGAETVGSGVETLRKIKTGGMCDMDFFSIVCGAASLLWLAAGALAVEESLAAAASDQKERGGAGQAAGGGVLR